MHFHDVGAYLGYVDKQAAWSNLHPIEACAEWLAAHAEVETVGSALAMALLHPQHYYDRRGDPIGRSLRPMHQKGKLPHVNADAQCQLHQLGTGLQCTKKRPQVDHVWPRSLGGANCQENYIRLCARCNQMKANSVLLFAWGHDLPRWAAKRLEQLEELKR